MRQGQPVMYAASDGSIGKWMLYRNDLKPPAYKVVYNFGTDVNGNALLSTAYHAHEIEYVEITEEEYAAHIKCRAWSKEQDVVRKQILERLKKERVIL